MAGKVGFREAERLLFCFLRLVSNNMLNADRSGARKKIGRRTEGRMAGAVSF